MGMALDGSPDPGAEIRFDKGPEHLERNDPSTGPNLRFGRKREYDYEGGRMFDGLCTNVGMRRIDPDTQLGRQGRLNLRQDRERHIKSRHEMCFSGREEGVMERQTKEMKVPCGYEDSREG